MQSLASAQAIAHAAKGTTIKVQEFQHFFQEELSLIYGYIYKKVGNRELAEDLTSEVFLKAVTGIKPEHDLRSMQYWLYLIARTTIADHWRVHYRLPVGSLDELLEAGWEGPQEKEPASISSSSADRVQHLLQALPERYREVLTCRFLLNLSLKDTASRMGVTVGHVKILQFRALKRAADLENVVTDIVK